MQPVGDPNAYDPGCFRLVRTEAAVIVKLTDGTFDVRTTVDDLYFENLPPNNRGAVGVVYYTFVSLDGACQGVLTPYQEVASGSDNEKFNGDYGVSIESLVSQEPDFAFAKAVDQTAIPPLPGLPATLAYTLTFTNTGAVSLGDPALNIPLVVEDSIPSGTEAFSFDIPDGTIGGSAVDLYARFRLFTEQPALPALASTGTTGGGEVEDYLFSFSPTDVRLASVHPAPAPGGQISIAVLFLLLVGLSLPAIYRRRASRQQP